MTLPVYLDNHATTPLDPRVLEAMLPYLGPRFGNAGSQSHAFGWAAAEAVAAARERVASLLGARAEELVFTSGATESDNLAILGAVAAKGARKPHVVTAATEHHAVLDACRELERRGAKVTVLRVDSRGRVDPADVAKALGRDTVLVSVMAANNEVGTIQPLAEIGRLTRERGVLFHCDAAQAAGKMPLDVGALGIDLLSLAGHKFHAPKGVGALYVRQSGPRVKLSPLQFGGGQERGIRPGTLNVPGIVALGQACEIARAELAAEEARVRALRDRLQAAVLAAAPDARVNGHPEHRLAGNLSVTFPGLDSEALLMELRRDVACSSGAACASGEAAPSHVLLALGLSARDARSTVRFGLGRFTTDAEIDRAAAAVGAALERLGSGKRQ